MIAVSLGSLRSPNSSLEKCNVSKYFSVQCVHLMYNSKYFNVQLISKFVTRRRGVQTILLTLSMPTTLVIKRLEAVISAHTRLIS